MDEISEHRNIHHGFIVHSWLFKGELRITGRLTSGESFAAIIKAPQKLWFTDRGSNQHSYAADLLREQEQAVLSDENNHINQSNKTKHSNGTAHKQNSVNQHWTTFSGKPLLQVPSSGPNRFPSGLNLVDELLLSRGIRGQVEIHGQPQQGKRVDLVFMNPHLVSWNSTTIEPRLTWAAVDIETDREGRVLAISLVQDARQQVFFIGPEVDHPDVQAHSTEQEALVAFARTLVEWDPDVITGWNVADFDFSVLAKRYELFRIPFEAGRAQGEPVQVRQTPSGMVRVVVPGRQVVDGMRIVRGSGRRFDDQRLETVAQEILGRGKLVEQSGEEKMQELERLRKESPLEFCLYCMEDSRLVLDILSTTGLDFLTQARAGLTGISLDLAWTSIPAFEQVYALELLNRSILPPQREEGLQVTGAAGGTVLDPTPGYFHNVMVFDFRSLYPSIMRTFTIDPLAYHRTPQLEPHELIGTPPAGLQGRAWESPRQPNISSHPDQTEPKIDMVYENSPNSRFLTAPNGARFAKEGGILPALLARYFDDRQAALDRGDETGAYVYKILMNSFYGVLGSAGCVYGRSELAGAITGFGRMCLHFARDFFQTRGMIVLYGDTDSVFVYARGKDMSAECSGLADQLNKELTRQIHENYGVQSKIQIRFDTAYSRFLLPKLRSGGPQDGELTIRGRAKGYAGLNRKNGEVEIKGMEAARSDYTALAQEFQTRLFGLLFGDGEYWEIEQYIRSVLTDLFAGKLDDKLVYRKVLRRPAREYTANVSPQVRAARMLGWTYQRGRVSYLMTLAGAEPVGRTTAAVDYTHYVEHQLKPIWLSIAEAADLGDRLVNPATWAEIIGKRTLMSMNPLDDQLELGL